MNTLETSNVERAARLAREALTSPHNTVGLALEHVANEVASGVKLTAGQLGTLKALLAQYENPDQQSAESEPEVAVQSVLDLCKYKKREDGVTEFVIPENMSVIQVFELANKECERLGINPGVEAGDFDWYEMNTSAATARKSDLSVSNIALADGSLGKNRSYQENKFTLPEIEHAALANALEWIASKGKVNSFRDHWVRTKTYGIGLFRYRHGVMIARGGEVADTGIGCSAVPN